MLSLPLLFLAKFYRELFYMILCSYPHVTIAILQQIYWQTSKLIKRGKTKKTFGWIFIDL